jgi:hypothetical protein
MVAAAQGHELKKADSVAPRLKLFTALNRAKHELSGLKPCADSVH